jgi:hypothetical protein
MNQLTRIVLVAGASTACATAQNPAPQQPVPQDPAAKTQTSSVPVDVPPPPINWKELTGKGLPIKFYGFFRFEVHYNTARMDSVVIPTRMLPETDGTPGAGEAKRNDDQISFDPRLTRFGVELTPVKVGETTVTGKLEMDFANFPTGTSESRATPRMRLGYIDVAEGDVALRVGQDWDTISPLFPSVNNEMLMWNAGNLGDRRPQMTGRWKPGTDTELKATLGLTGAINNEDLDGGAANSERDGFGVWGMVGRTETDTAFGGEHRFDTWTGGVDVMMPLTSSLTLRGEGWVGENLGDVRGGMGQTINTSTGNEIGSAGGWAELVFAVTGKTKFHVGGSLDDPNNDDLSTTLANANRRRNQAAYCGTAVEWDSGVRTGLDVTYWQSEYMGATGTNGSTGNGIRCDLWFHLAF